MNGIRALIKWTPRAPLSLPSSEDTARRQPFMNQKAGPHETPNPSVMIFEFPPSKTVRNEFVVYKPPSYKHTSPWYAVIPAQTDYDALIRKRQRE